MTLISFVAGCECSVQVLTVEYSKIKEMYTSRIISDNEVGKQIIPTDVKSNQDNYSTGKMTLTFQQITQHNSVILKQSNNVKHLYQ